MAVIETIETLTSIVNQSVSIIKDNFQDEEYIFVDEKAFYQAKKEGLD